MMPSAGRDGWRGAFSVLVLHNILGVKACSVNSNVAIDVDNDTHRINNIVKNSMSCSYPSAITIALIFSPNEGQMVCILNSDGCTFLLNWSSGENNSVIFTHNTSAISYRLLNYGFPLTRFNFKF